jgi:hypothetical protein
LAVILGRGYFQYFGKTMTTWVRWQRLTVSDEYLGYKTGFAAVWECILLSNISRHVENVIERYQQ